MNMGLAEGRSLIVLQELPVNWKGMVGLGVFMMLFGFVGLIAANLLTLTSILIFGGFILGGGLLQLVHAVKAQEKEWGGKLQHVLIALLYLLVGLIILWDPWATSVVLTVFLVSLFAVMGVARIWYAFQSRKQGWRWLFIALLGSLNLLLTVLVIITLPESALWLIGFLVAIEMLMNGSYLLFLGLSVRKIDQAV
jgi:uncharacterized membrane protein HdeD (DUF308 family)